MATILRTERLTLRPPHEGDIEPIFRACQDPDIQRFTTIPVPYSRADAEYFVHRVAAERGARVIETHGGEFVGCMGVSVSAGSGDTGSVGYWCLPEQRSKGYVTEALRVVVDEALSPDGLALAALTWEARRENHPSARIAARVGFRYRGSTTIRLRGHDEPALAAVLRAGDDRTPQLWPALQH